MSIYKRGGVYWYKFMWKGEVVRESTKQGNDKVARQMEAAHRTSLAKGEVGIRDKKQSPTLADFCDCRFEPWAKSTFAKSSQDVVGFLPRRHPNNPKLQALVGRVQARSSHIPDNYSRGGRSLGGGACARRSCASA